MVAPGILLEEIKMNKVLELVSTLLSHNHIDDYAVLASNDDFMRMAVCRWMSRAQVIIEEDIYEDDESIMSMIHAEQIELAGVMYTPPGHSKPLLYIITIVDGDPTECLHYGELCDLGRHYGMQFTLSKNTRWEEVLTSLTEARAHQSEAKPYTLRSALAHYIQDDNTETVLICRLGETSKTTKPIFFLDGEFHEGGQTYEGGLAVTGFLLDMEKMTSDDFVILYPDFKVPVMPTFYLSVYGERVIDNDDSPAVRFESSGTSGADLWLFADFELNWQTCYDIGDPERQAICAEAYGFWFLRTDVDDEKMYIKHLPDEWSLEKPDVVNS